MWDGIWWVSKPFQHPGGFCSGCTMVHISRQEHQNSLLDLWQLHFFGPVLHRLDSIASHWKTAETNFSNFSPKSRYERIWRYTKGMSMYEYVWVKEVSIWVFPKIGVPQNGWFIMENPVNKRMIWGVFPLFLETPMFWDFLKPFEAEAYPARQKMAEDFARLKAWRAQSGTEGRRGSSSDVARSHSKNFYFRLGSDQLYFSIKNYHFSIFFM